MLEYRKRYTRDAKKLRHIEQITEFGTVAKADVVAVLSALPSVM